MHKPLSIPFNALYRTFAMCLFVIAGAAPRNAASPTSQEVKPVYLDIEFMVDQTEAMSMGNPNHTVAPLDADNHRNEAVRYAVNWLGELRARQAEQGTPLNISVGMWNYGGPNPAQCVVELQALTASTVDDWIKSQGTSSNSQATAAAPSTTQSTCNTGGHPLAAIRNNKAVFPGDVHGGLHGVDYIGTFSKVGDELQKYSTALPGTHNQYVIVITGSQPALPPNSSSNLAGEIHIQMGDLFSKDLSNGPLKPANIYVLALKAGRYGFRDAAYALPDLVQPWIDDVHVPKENVTAIDNAYALSGDLHDVLQQKIVTSVAPNLPAAPNVPLSSPYSVPAYQKWLTVTLIKQTAKARLKIEASGQPFSDTTQGVSIDGADAVVETWRIANPPPGDWTFSADRGTGVEALAETEPLAFTAKVAANTVNQYAPFTLIFSSPDTGTDANPQKLTELTQSYPDQKSALHVQAIVIAPSGNKDTVDLLPDKDTGTYRAKYAPTEAGLYQTVINAKTDESANILYDSSSDPNLKSSGLPVTANAIHFDVQFAQPVSGQHTDTPTVTQTEQLQGILQTVDAQKSAIPVPEIMSNVKQATLLLVDPKTSCSGLTPDKAQDKADFAFDDKQKVWQILYTPPKNVPQNTYKVCLGLQLAVEQGTAPKTINFVTDAHPTITVKSVSELVVAFNKLPGTTTEWPATIETSLLPQPNPLDVQVAVYRQPAASDQAVTDADGNIQQDLLVNLPDTAHNVAGLTLSVINVDNPTLIELYPLQATQRNGYWVAHISSLDAGHYNLQVVPPAGVLGTSSDEFSLASYNYGLNVTVPPVRYAKGVGLLAGVTLLGVGLIQFTRPRFRPVRGQISVWAYHAATRKAASRWLLDLTPRRRNRVICKVSELPLFNPTLSHLEFRRGSTNDSLRVKVGVRGELRGPRPI